MEEGLRRAGARETDESRFESKGSDFHHQVRHAFLELAAQEPNRFVVVDAARHVDVVSADIIEAVMPRLAVAGIS